MAKVLLGFMGSGKTTIARQLDSDFVDMDALLEGRLGMPIARFFEEKGEAAFRQLEEEVLADLLKTDKVISTVVENAKVSVPEKLVDQEVESMFEQFAGNLSRQGLSFDLYEQFTGKTADELKSEMRSDAENKIKTSFVLADIATAEKIEVTDADIDAEVKKLAEMYSMTDEGVRSRISVEDLRGELSIQKTIEFLKENN